MNLVYRFTDIISKAKAGDLNLDIPDDFKVKDLDQFLGKSIDFTGPEYKDEFGTGLSFYEIDSLLKRNREALLEAFGKDAEYYQRLVQRMRNDLGSRTVDGQKMDATSGLKRIFLTHHRSIQRRVACVYSIIKDTYVFSSPSFLNDSLTGFYPHSFFSFAKQDSKAHYCCLPWVSKPFHEP